MSATSLISSSPRRSLVRCELPLPNLSHDREVHLSSRESPRE
jgi:hypothetical protein